MEAVADVCRMETLRFLNRNDLESVQQLHQLDFYYTLKHLHIVCPSLFNHTPVDIRLVKQFSQHSAHPEPVNYDVNVVFQQYGAFLSMIGSDVSTDQLRALYQREMSKNHFSAMAPIVA